MLHLPKKLSRQEREEYQRWLESHRLPEPSKLEQERRAKTFFEKQAAQLEALRVVRWTHSEIPSLPAVEVQTVTKPELSEEMQRREDVARKIIEERRFQCAPAYNKGGDVYWTEEMAKEFAAGGHRRR